MEAGYKASKSLEAYLSAFISLEWEGRELDCWVGGHRFKPQTRPQTMQSGPHDDKDDGMGRLLSDDQVWFATINNYYMSQQKQFLIFFCAKLFFITEACDTGRAGI